MTKQERAEYLSKGLTIQAEARRRLDREEAFNIARALQGKTNEVMRGIKQFAPEGTPATRSLLKNLNQYSTKSLIGAKSVSLKTNASLQELQRFISNAQKFLDPGRTRLNTVEKSRQYIERLNERLPGYEDLTTRQRKQFWDAYETYIEMNPARGEQNAQYGSDWVQKTLISLVSDRPDLLAEKYAELEARINSEYSLQRGD